MGVKLSTSLEALGAQVVGLENSPRLNWFIDTAGVEEDFIRNGASRSVNRLTRLPLALANAGDESVFLRTMTGEIIHQLDKDGASISTAADIINTVNQAIVSAASTDVGDATEPTADSPSISVKKMVAAITVVNENGLFVLDDIGNAHTDGLFRPKTARSARQNFRRLVKLNGDQSTLRLNTATGLITRQIADDNPSTVAAFLTSLRKLKNSTSTSSTTTASLPKQTSTASLQVQLGDLLVVAGDGTVCVDDDGEPKRSRANKKQSLFQEIKRLVEKNSGSSDSWRLQTASGKKWKKVAGLNAATATLSDILAKLQGNV